MVGFHTMLSGITATSDTTAFSLDALRKPASRKLPPSVYKRPPIWATMISYMTPSVVDGINVSIDNVSDVDVTTSDVTTSNSLAYTTSWKLFQVRETTARATSIHDDVLDYYIDQLTPLERKKLNFKEQIRRQLTPNIITKRNGINRNYENEAELRARELLREMIPSDEFKKYLKTGYLTIYGRSGMIYHVSGLQKMIRCYVKGNDGKYKAVEDLCIIFDNEYDELPFTDWVIMRKLLIEHDEFGMRKIAIPHKIEYALAGAY